MNNKQTKGAVLSDKKASGAVVGLAVTSLVAGILIGVVGAGVYDINNTLSPAAPQEATISEAEIEFQAALSERFSELSSLTYVWQQALYAERADADSIATAWEASLDDIEQILRQYHNEDKVETLAIAIRSYHETANAYIVAAAAGDLEALSELETALEEQVTAMATELEELTNGEGDEWEDLALDYAQAMLQATTSYAASNYDESYRSWREAHASAIELAHAVVAATVSQYPEQF